MKRLISTAIAAVACGIVGVAPSLADGGKLQICHGTASASNPYVLINVSLNAAPTHLDGHGWQNAPDMVYDPSFASCAAQAAGGGGSGGL